MIQTLDSVALGPYATQTRDASTAALVAAVAARTIQMDVIPDASSDPAIVGTTYVYTPLTGTSQAIPSDAEAVIIDPAGTIAALTLVMPETPYDGQELTLTFDAVVTALTMTPGTGQTLKGALTAGAVAGFATWRYRATGTTWWRVG